jgi:hypothetical protein
MSERKRWVIVLLCAAALALWSVLDAIERRGRSEDPRRAALPRVPTHSASPSRLLRHAAAEGTLLSGVVRDRQRHAVAGATVCAACAGCNTTGPAEATCVRSGGDGRYGFEGLAPAAYHVTATAPGFAATSAAAGRALVIAAGERRSDVDIELRPGGALVAGTVLDATGGPIGGARVRAVRSQVPAFVLETTSEDDGSFEFALAGGYVKVSGQADGYAPAQVGVVAPTRDVELVLVPGSRVEGVVVEAGTGRPLSDVVVRAVPQQFRNPRLERSAITQAGGAFAIAGLEPGTYALVAKGDRVQGEAPQPIAVELAQHLSGVKIEVVAAAEVLGRVVERGSQTPCREGTVVLGSPSPLEPPPPAPPGAAGLSPGKEQVAAIEADGSVHFPGVPPGLYYVTVQCRERVYASGPRALLLSHEPVSGLRWEVDDTGSIAVRVFDAAGRPVPDYPFVAERGQAWTGGSLVTMPGRTDEVGLYTLHGLPSGGYTVRPSSPNHGTPVPVQLSVEQPRAEVTMRLSGSGSILVDVRDGQGEAIHAVQVTVYRAVDPDEAARGPDALPVDPQRRAAPSLAGARLQQRKVDAVALGNGRFRAGPLPAGGYVVSARDGVNPPAAPLGAREGDEESARVEVVDGKDSAITLVIARAGSIRGRVVDEAGEPLASTWVEAKYEQGGEAADPLSMLPVRPLANRGGRVLTDPEGRFVIEGLREHGARFSLVVRQPGGSETRRANVEVGADVEITLPAAGSLRGVVVDAQGRPVPAFSARVRNRQTGTTQHASFQGALGSFSFTSVAPGPLQLEAFDDRGGHGEASLDLASGQEHSSVRLVLQAEAPLAVSLEGPR